MKAIINFTKRLLRLYHLKKFNSFKIKPKLSEAQIEELIEVNKETLVQLGDEADYDGMGNYGRFPPQKSRK